ncbi:hypothetical protein C8J57DRAFT_1313560 [Mycena rebaudengoi]|nr:hypothetical protein C8J57DRAFT_1313560 [Mycena rebaudengoi]
MATAAPGFSPNFSATYSVVLAQPIDAVFAMLATRSAGHERVCRLSSLCTAFELLEKDVVALSGAESSLSEVHLRTAPASASTPVDTDANAGEAGTGPVDGTAGKLLPRQHFRMTETVITLGVIKTAVHLEGTLTWDAAGKEALYETYTKAQGISVWKLRVFEEVEENKTRVSETIQGRCPALLKFIVQSETSKSHKAHMEMYHTLF